MRQTQPFGIEYHLLTHRRKGREIDLAFFTGYFSSIIQFRPLFIERTFGTYKKSHGITDVRQPLDTHRIEIAPRQQRSLILTQTLEFRFLHPAGFVHLIQMQKDICRTPVRGQRYIRRFHGLQTVYPCFHMLCLFEFGLQFGCRLYGTLLCSLHVQYPQLLHPLQESFILLIVNKESKFLHLRNHASASFLFS